MADLGSRHSPGRDARTRKEGEGTPSAVSAIGL